MSSQPLKEIEGVLSNFEALVHDLEEGSLHCEAQSDDIESDSLPTFEQSTRNSETEFSRKLSEVRSRSGSQIELPDSQVPSQAMCSGSVGLQSELVDGAISRISSSLPSEVLRVVHLQRDQTSHIAQLQGELQMLQEQSSKAQARCVETKEETERVARAAHFTRQDNVKATHRCVRLKTAIGSLVAQCDSAQRAVQAQRLELQTTRSKLEQYTHKLQDHLTAISASNQTQAQISLTEERIAALMEKKSSMEENAEDTEKIRNGSAEKRVREAVEELNQQSDRMTEETRLIQDRIEKVRAKQQNVKQATTVLRKRNAAQILRLKRQVKEQELRHRQWRDQARLLQNSVASLTCKLQAGKNNAPQTF